MPLKNRLVTVPGSVGSTGSPTDVTALKPKRTIVYIGTAGDVIEVLGSDDAAGTRMRHRANLGPSSRADVSIDVDDASLAYSARLVTGTGAGIMAVYAEPVDAGGAAQGHIAAVIVADLPTGGVIGTAATTVDVAGAFLINQTTQQQTPVSLPAPTDASAAQFALVFNIGTAPFILYGQVLLAGALQAVAWNGTAWATGQAFSFGGNAIGRAQQIGPLDTFPLSLNTDGQQRLTIDAAGRVGIGTTTPQATLDFHGSMRVGMAPAISNIAGGGVIGTAGQTVDVFTAVNINQTTAGQVLSLPPPTNPAAGAVFFVSNNGSTSFTMHGVVLTVNTTPQTAGALFFWTSSAWIKV